MGLLTINLTHFKIAHSYFKEVERFLLFLKHDWLSNFYLVKFFF